MLSFFFLSVDSILGIKKKMSLTALEELYILLEIITVEPGKGVVITRRYIGFSFLSFFKKFNYFEREKDCT